MDLKMRLKRLAICAAVLIICSAPGRAQEAASWQAGPSVVERSTRDQPGFNFEEARVPPYTLPDLMGTAETKNAWRRRREILEVLIRRAREGVAAIRATWYVGDVGGLNVSPAVIIQSLTALPPPVKYAATS